MTVLSSETSLVVGAGTGLLPRVNLLPPEIAEGRAFRRIQLGLGAAMAVACGLVGMLYLSATHSVSSANAELDRAKSQNASLQVQAASYKNVTAIYAAAAAAQAQLTSAMGDEVRYSQLLNDLALSVPTTVWLKNVSLTSAAPPAAATAAPVVGTFTVTGVGFSHDDVALWLESIAGLKTYVNPYFSSSTEALLGTRKTVNFTSTASLTPAAFSGRYNKPVGG